MSVGEQDPFEGVTFDESWVSSARRSEAPAAHRAPSRVPTAMPEAEPPRRQGKRNPIKVATTLLVTVLVVAGLTGLVIHDRQTAAVAPSAGGLAPAATATPAPVLYGFDLERVPVGTCLYWDRTHKGATQAAVPCAQPHRAEVTKVIQLSGAKKWPGNAYLADVVRRECQPALLKYLQAPAGRPDTTFASLVPTESGWPYRGQKAVVCTAMGVKAALFTGTLRGAGSMPSSSPPVMSS